MNVPIQDLKQQFLGWQCRIRQLAMRQDEGRPSAGMCPRALSLSGELLSERIVVLINHAEPYEHTAYFKFQVQKNHDPNVVREKGLDLLKSTYYQKSKEFTDELTSLFLNGSQTAQTLLSAETCVLEFSQFSQEYRLVCKIELAGQFDPCREATIWHNRIFNPQMPNAVQVLKFLPDWQTSATQ